MSTQKHTIHKDLAQFWPVCLFKLNLLDQNLWLAQVPKLQNAFECRTQEKQSLAKRGETEERYLLGVGWQKRVEIGTKSWRSQGGGEAEGEGIHQIHYQNLAPELGFRATEVKIG